MSCHLLRPLMVAREGPKKARGLAGRSEVASANVCLWWGLHPSPEMACKCQYFIYHLALPLEFTSVVRVSKWILLLGQVQLIHRSIVEKDFEAGVGISWPPCLLSPWWGGGSSVVGGRVTVPSRLGPCAHSAACGQVMLRG